ncbi:MAG: hypothetical protein H0T73_04715 [Ardenticatenales bacterium]|nr:hypothetical protein [Ardenticatenales bacterium]
MSQDNFETDEYEYYLTRFNLVDRAERRSRKASQGSKKAPSPVVERAESRELEEEFTTTYQPGRYEEGWLLSSLRPFYDQGLISDVLAQVKGGKEASVYRCAGHPTTGHEWLAAKVYRPRKFRNLRNDKMYRQGREILGSDGSPVKKNDDRVMRAIGKKTAFGMEVAHTSWLMHEYITLQQLHRAGAAVPEPLAVGENAILMSYLGDARRAAPTLHEVHLDLDEAEVLFAEVLRNIELMLTQGLIHGDLSAYNILYWEGKITLIDFPQVTRSQSNSDARFILERDLARVCDYFAGQGVACDADTLIEELWLRYIGPQEEELWFPSDMFD